MIEQINTIDSDDVEFEVNFYDTIQCEQIPLGDFPLSELQPIIDEKTVSSMTRFIERKTGIKLYPESAVEHWRHHAKVAEKKATSWENTATKEHETVLYWQDRAEKAEALLNQKKVD